MGSGVVEGIGLGVGEGAGVALGDGSGVAGGTGVSVGTGIGVALESGAGEALATGAGEGAGVGDGAGVTCAAAISIKLPKIDLSMNLYLMVMGIDERTASPRVLRAMISMVHVRCRKNGSFGTV